ncbi:glycosyltransferase family 4 protein [Nocardioides massiliensis]|uniref:Glycosyltransferase involved in cell wall biosynthesis n=1 Tax=Nocardioides massiliensis TaxID=1325935 RepID=A0ABT9NMY9_9ACTN|nr:glycosyltransferase family 4 protein [Nocardioides massiliensis]MDP9821794.1 glycosyltransferase involved in cell wall biosynthesis [Nocardioides massiliensis]
MTKLAFVCQWFPPEPIEIPRNIALSLGSCGHEVSVLTGVPNYPTGRVAEGHRALELRMEEIDGLPVRRTPLYPSHDSGALGRIANYVSWAVSSALFGQRMLRAAEATLVYSSPATAALPAMVARRLWGTPYVLLIQDVWPDSVLSSGFIPGAMGRVVHRIIDAFVRRAYAWSDHVAVISPGMVDLLTARGVPREKLSVVHNWVPEEDQAGAATCAGDTHISLADRVGASADDRLFLYAGNHGRAQALDGVVRAFLDDRTAPAQLVLVGDGVTKKQLVKLAGNHPRVHFLAPVDRAEAGRLLEDADVSVVALADEPLFAVTMPSKVQSGLASARPMLVVARGDAASVVIEADAGAAAPPGDIDAIVEAVRTLLAATPDELTAMGSRGRDLYRSSMARAVGAARLSDLLDSAAQRRGSRGGHTAPTHPERKRS